MNRLASLLIIVPIVGYLVISSSLFTVDEREWAVMFRFGEIIRTDFKPGLHFKMPITNTVKKFDRRIQTLDAPAVRYQTVELKNVVVDSFVQWRINDVARYFVAIGSDDITARMLQNMSDLSRSEFGERTVKEVVSGDRSQIMTILKEKNNEFASHFGVEVVDVRIKRVDLPKEVSDSVFQRMEAERTRVAKDLRSKGAAQAEEIRATADKERTILLAEANREAELIRGEGDAAAAAIYANAYSADPSFYRLYRSLNAYRTMLKSGKDVMVLQPEGDFFRFFNEAGAANNR